jgi:hypothetical protein
MAAKQRATETAASPASARRRLLPLPAWAGPSLLAASGFALALLAIAGVEAAARWLSPGYLVETRGLHVFSETLGWKHRTNASAVIGGKHVSINAAGYRGHELSVTKPAGTTRVVVLGDSVAFGLGVSDGETFADLLQARENGLETGNLAVQGYGPGQALLVLLGQALETAPDVVVLAFCMENDFADALLPVSLYDGRTPQPRFRLEGESLVLDRAGLRRSPPQRVGQWLADHSYLFNRLGTLRPRPEPAGARHWTDIKHEALRDEQHALRLNVAIVRRMAAVCRERGIRFLLAAFPHWFTYRSKPWLAQGFLDALETGGIPVLDMSERFVARGESFRAIALDGTGHLSRLGHAIAAEELESAIAVLPAAATDSAHRSDGRPRALSGRTARRSP